MIADPDAVYRQYRRLVEFICRKRARSPEEFEDLVGAAWLAVFQKLREYDPTKSSLSTYVGLKAKQACWEARRKSTVRQRGEAATLRFSECSVEPDTAIDESGYDRVEALDLVRTMCAGITARQIEILEVVVDCSGSQADAAKRLGVSRAMISKAIGQIRAKIIENNSR